MNKKNAQQIPFRDLPGVHPCGFATPTVAAQGVAGQLTFLVYDNTYLFARQNPYFSVICSVDQLFCFG